MGWEWRARSLAHFSKVRLRLLGARAHVRKDKNTTIQTPSINQHDIADENGPPTAEVCASNCIAIVNCAPEIPRWLKAPAAGPDFLGCWHDDSNDDSLLNLWPWSINYKTGTF